MTQGGTVPTSETILVVGGGIVGKDGRCAHALW